MNIRLLIQTFALSILLTIVLTGCLKTRSQIRGEEGEDLSKPTTAKIQAVEAHNPSLAEELKGEVTQLTGRIEDLERATKQVRELSEKTDKQKEEIKKQDARIHELEQAQAAMIDSIKKIQNTVPPSDPQEELELGKTAFGTNNFEKAVEHLSAYLRAPHAKQADDATWLRAESYMALKEYKKAIVDYSKFPEKFTKSPRVPTSLLKIGQAFDAMGLHEDAQGFYQELVEKFPKSSEAKKLKAKPEKKKKGKKQP